MDFDEKNNLENTIKSLESSYHNLSRDWERSLGTIEELRDEIKALKDEVAKNIKRENLSYELMGELEELEKQTEILRKEVDDWKGMYRVISERETLHLKEIEELEKQNEIMKESLEFYANEDNWCYMGIYDVPGVMIDESDEESFGTKYIRGGRIARQALEKIK